MAKPLDTLILRLHEVWHEIRKEAARRKSDTITLMLQEQAAKKYQLPAELAGELLGPAGYLFAGVRKEDLYNPVSCQVYNLKKHVGSVTYNKTKKGIEVIIQAFEPMSELEVDGKLIYFTDLVKSR